MDGVEDNHARMQLGENSSKQDSFGHDETIPVVIAGDRSSDDILKSNDRSLQNRIPNNGGRASRGKSKSRSRSKYRRSRSRSRSRSKYRRSRSKYRRSRSRSRSSRKYSRSRSRRKYSRSRSRRKYSRSRSRSRYRNNSRSRGRERKRSRKRKRNSRRSRDPDNRSRSRSRNNKRPMYTRNNYNNCGGRYIAYDHGSNKNIISNNNNGGNWGKTMVRNSGTNNRNKNWGESNGGDWKRKQQQRLFQIEHNIEERTECFEIKCDKRWKPCSFDFPEIENKPFVGVLDLMSNGGFTSKSVVEQLWSEKSRMDYVFDSGQAKIYYRVRSEIFPQDQRGSQAYGNRAGDKLFEVEKQVELFDNLKGKCRPLFIDVCGGPGAFSQFLFYHPYLDHPEGYGITLKTPDTPQTDGWYKDLVQNAEFSICIGQDGSGDVYKPSSIESMRKVIKENDHPFDQSVDVVVSDGGFEIKKNEEGEHMENYQEMYSGRIILSELLFAIEFLQEGGHFVCKLFDCFSKFTQSLIYLATQVFEEVFIVKPLRSRIVNSERYLVGKKLRNRNAGWDTKEEVEKERKMRLVKEQEKQQEDGKNNENNDNESDNIDNNEEKAVEKEEAKSCKTDDSDSEGGQRSSRVEDVLELLRKVHRNCENDLLPISLVPPDEMLNDVSFMQSSTDMVTKIGEKQLKALKLVMDEVEKKIEKKTGD